MHYFDHTIDNRIKFFYFIRSLLPPKSPILAKYWWGPLTSLLDLWTCGPPNVKLHTCTTFMSHFS